MTNRALHDAAMAAKRFHDAVLLYLNRPEDPYLRVLAELEQRVLIDALELIRPSP